MSCRVVASLACACVLEIKFSFWWFIAVIASSMDDEMLYILYKRNFPFHAGCFRGGCQTKVHPTFAFQAWRASGGYQHGKVPRYVIQRQEGERHFPHKWVSKVLNKHQDLLSTMSIPRWRKMKVGWYTAEASSSISYNDHALWHPVLFISCHCLLRLSNLHANTSQFDCCFMICLTSLKHIRVLISWKCLSPSMTVSSLFGFTLNTVEALYQLQNSKY